MGWAGWTKFRGPPSAGVPEFQAKNVHVGETFNRFADAFGVRTPPGAAGRAIALLQTPSRYKGSGARERPHILSHDFWR